jgi:hypothetical protein
VAYSLATTQIYVRGHLFGVIRTASLPAFKLRAPDMSSPNSVPATPRVILHPHPLYRTSPRRPMDIMHQSHGLQHVARVSQKIHPKVPVQREHQDPPRHPRLGATADQTPKYPPRRHARPTVLPRTIFYPRQAFQLPCTTYQDHHLPLG